MQRPPWDEGHGGGGVVAGATAGEIGDVENAVGGEDIVAAGGAEVPDGLEFLRIEIDVGGVAFVAGGGEVGAGAQRSAAAPEPLERFALLRAAGEIVHLIIIRPTDEQAVAGDVAATFKIPFIQLGIRQLGLSMYCTVFTFINSGAGDE